MKLKISNTLLYLSKALTKISKCSIIYISSQTSSVQSLSHIWLFVTPWTSACQASLSITKSRGLLKLMFIESVMSSNHLIFCHPLLFLASIFPSIKVFSSDSVLIRWSNFWSLSFSISPSSEYSGLIFSPLGWTSWISSQSNTTVQKHKFIDVQFS